MARFLVFDLNRPLTSGMALLLRCSHSFILWRRPKATKQSLLIMACWTVLLSILSARLQLKLLLLWVWFQFFIVWPVQDRYPRYRRALNPWWWLLWNVPNDAESALEILKSRAATTTSGTATPPNVTRSRSASNASFRSSHSLLKHSVNPFSLLKIAIVRLIR